MSGWIPTDIDGGDWGQIRVVIQGVDVTRLRGAVTLVQNWQHTDPYGPNSATIVFPKVRGYDDVDSDGNYTAADLKGWLKNGAKVRIYNVLNDAVVSHSDPPFNGWIDSIEDGDPTTVTCSGNFNGRMSMRMHQPDVVRRDARDAGRLIAHFIGANHWIDLYPRYGLVTGMPMQFRGSRDMSKLGAIDEVLGRAIKEDGSSTTILPDSSKGINAFRHQWRVLKDTPDATVDYDAGGVKVNMRRDLTDAVTAVYGEGVAPNGERWRNAKYQNLGTDNTKPDYPFADGRSFGMGTTDAETVHGDGISIMCRELWSDGILAADDLGTHTFDDDVDDAIREMQRNLGRTVDGQMTPSLWAALFNRTGDHMSFDGAHFQALAQDLRTRWFNRAGDGTILGRNFDFDFDVPHVEQFIGYGESTTKKEGRRNARGIVARGAHRSGTVTLTSDPAEMSRFDLRAGMTLQIRHYLGGRKVYISSVQVDWSSQNRPVTLAVSTTPRHYLDLLTIKQRRQEARQNPANRWAHQLRRSAQTSDRVSGWEGESGAGIIRPTALKGGQWNLVQMVACEVGTMGNLHMQTNPPTAWQMTALGDHVSEQALAANLGDPTQWIGTGANQEDTWQAHDQWLRDNWRIESWGPPNQRCGYHPHVQTNASGQATSYSPTGELRDEGSWNFGTQNNFIWWAVWPEADTTLTGRCRIQDGDTV